MTPHLLRPPGLLSHHVRAVLVPLLRRMQHTMDVPRCRGLSGWALDGGTCPLFPGACNTLRSTASTGTCPAVEGSVAVRSTAGRARSFQAHAAYYGRRCRQGRAPLSTGQWPGARRRGVPLFPGAWQHTMVAHCRALSACALDWPAVVARCQKGPHASVLESASPPRVSTGCHCPGGGGAGHWTAGTPRGLCPLPSGPRPNFF